MGRSRQRYFEIEIWIKCQCPEFSQELSCNSARRVPESLPTFCKIRSTSTRRISLLGEITPSADGPKFLIQVFYGINRRRRNQYSNAGMTPEVSASTTYRPEKIWIGLGNSLLTRAKPSVYLDVLV
jgi:hypothetical protein